MNTIKIILISLFCTLLHSQMAGQAFKLEELAGFNKLDMAAFKTEIKNHKYTFYDKTESPEFILFEYDSPGYMYKIGKFEYTEEKSQDNIEFQFKDKKEHDAYVKAILTAGYKQTEKGKVLTGESYVDYLKNKAQIRMVYPKTSRDNYTILVFK
ncbi:omptin family protein [Chryseobacterium sp. 52]|uniref:omptin family outer membrane protease n=1 Tax=Chryseobacterium sp. 52 TaxID=2035213 RepID=UPI000C5BBC52|nr:omptin family outer membrane protease [Chryseobacterium sp. 52]PIF44640.1 omptin family protein [Chryseobacterium sp. 52]